LALPVFNSSLFTSLLSPPLRLRGISSAFQKPVSPGKGKIDNEFGELAKDAELGQQSNDAIKNDEGDDEDSDEWFVCVLHKIVVFR
jgi:hypothetical protein